MVKVMLKGPMVERGSAKRGFRFVQAYHEVNPDNGNLLYPAIIKSEAYAQAKRDGEKAKFFDTRTELDSWVEMESYKSERATCPHYVDNQGFCHKCGILMDEGTARDSGYFQEGMVEGK